MKYFLAVPTANKPFIHWAEWAGSIEELTEMGEFENPLIVSADNLPPFTFGVCPLKIVDGELVDRDSVEMDGYETEYNAKLSFVAHIADLKNANNETFDFGTNTFPMHEIFRTRYDLAKQLPEKDTYYMTVKGVAVLIGSADLAAFATAYHTKLDTITNPYKLEE